MQNPSLTSQNSSLRSTILNPKAPEFRPSDGESTQMGMAIWSPIWPMVEVQGGQLQQSDHGQLVSARDAARLSYDSLLMRRLIEAEKQAA